MARIRITGTVEAAIEIEESLLGRRLPQSFRAWLLENNALGIGNTYVYPVRDERDTRKTWNSLSYNMENEWSESLGSDNKLKYAHLLPFADSGITDYFCFDYSDIKIADERPVVLWKSESGDVEYYADNFNDFKDKIMKSVTRTERKNQSASTTRSLR